MNLLKNNKNENFFESLTVLLISDDTKQIAFIQNTLSICEEPKLDLIAISNGLNKLENIQDVNLILLDKNFGSGDFIENLSLINQENALPIILLLDEKNLTTDLMKLSESIKYGVCDFIVNSEISLNNLLKLVSKYSVEPKKIKNVNLKESKTKYKTEPSFTKNIQINNEDIKKTLNINSTSENDWMNIAKSLPIMCLVLNQEGLITKVVSNDYAGMNFFPHAKEGQTLNDVFGVNTFDNFSEAISKTLNTGLTHQQTIAHTTNDGVRWLDTFITNLRGNLDLSRQVIWTAFDVTTGRQSYQELLKNYDSLTDTINEAPVMFCQRDVNGRFQSVNRAFCEFFNVRADIVAGRQSSEIFSGLTFENMTQNDKEVIEKDKTISYSYEDRSNDNNFNVHWQKFPLKSQTSNKIESIVSFGFISEHNEIDSKKHNKIENSIASNIATPIIETSGAINQDFKAVIKNISNYTEIALAQKNEAREKKVEDHIKKVIHASERALSLLSKNKHDEKTNHFELTKLEPLVVDIIDILKPTLPSSLIFNYEIEKFDGKAYVIPSEFQKLVMQLIISARDNPKNKQNEILLALKNEKFNDESCINCNEKIEGEYITLSVTTSNEDIDTKNLKKMIEATDIEQINNSSQIESKNVIVMTHINSGHVLLDLENEKICLKLLFKNIVEKTDDKSPNIKKNASKV